MYTYRCLVIASFMCEFTYALDFGHINFYGFRLISTRILIYIVEGLEGLCTLLLTTHTTELECCAPGLFIQISWLCFSTQVLVISLLIFTPINALLRRKTSLIFAKSNITTIASFHTVQKDFLVQTGDPTGTGSGGDSIYKFLYGEQARFFNDEIHQNLKHDKVGVVAMASAGENLNASQFYITTRTDLDYLDGKHTVFGVVAEGEDILMKINEAFVDEKNRPFKNIRIKHTYLLDDPFEDPAQLSELIPENSPTLRPPAEVEEVRLEDDWVPMDEQLDSEELDKSLRRKEAHSRAVVLVIIGDIPDAEIKPPENVLFVCKLNPVTQNGRLHTHRDRDGRRDLLGTQSRHRLESPEKQYSRKSLEDKHDSRDHRSENHRENKDGEGEKRTD